MPRWRVGWRSLWISARRTPSGLRTSRPPSKRTWLRLMRIEPHLKDTPKNAPRRLMSIVVTHADAATEYLQIFDAVAVPANGTVPRAVLACPTAASSSLDYGGAVTASFVNGIAWSMSTTLATLTKATTAVT